MGLEIWRRYMDGHPTDDDGREAAQEVHSSPEVGDLAGMGVNGKRSGCFTSSRDSSHDPVSMEETVGTRGRRVSQGDPIQTQPRGKGTTVYCRDGYLSLATARSSIGQWIEYSNEVRPHQALFGYRGLLSTAPETRLSFLKSTGATWKKPNRKEGKSGFLIIRNQQLFSLEMSETVQTPFQEKSSLAKGGPIAMLVRFPRRSLGKAMERQDVPLYLEIFALFP